jgi:hypothetical protein
LAKAPKNAPTQSDDWDEQPPAAEVPAVPHIDIVCVSPDRPHIADNIALLPGERATVPHPIAKKLLKSRHVVRAEDYDEDMLPKAPVEKDDDE